MQIFVSLHAAIAHVQRQTVGGSRDQRSKCASVFSQAYRPIFLSLPLSHTTQLLHTHTDTLYINSLCLRHYNRKSWHSVVLVKKGLSVESWHKTMSKLRQIQALFLLCSCCAVISNPLRTQWRTRAVSVDCCLHACVRAGHFAFQLQRSGWQYTAPHKALGTAGTRTH